MSLLKLTRTFKIEEVCILTLSDMLVLPYKKISLIPSTCQDIFGILPLPYFLPYYATIRLHQFLSSSSAQPPPSYPCCLKKPKLGIVSTSRYTQVQASLYYFHLSNFHQAKTGFMLSKLVTKPSVENSSRKSSLGSLLHV